MMTSNRPLEDWGKLLGDVPSATAILDRFLHHAEIISITGRSYRLKDRGERSDDPKEPATKEKKERRADGKRSHEQRSGLKRPSLMRYTRSPRYWLVMKRPFVAGFEAPRDTSIAS